MLTSEGAVKPVVSLVSLVARRLGVTVALVPTPSRMRERSPMANVFIVGKLSRIELDGRAEMVNTEGTDKGSVCGDELEGNGKIRTGELRTDSMSRMLGRWRTKASFSRIYTLQRARQSCPILVLIAVGCVQQSCLVMYVRYLVESQRQLFSLILERRRAPVGSTGLLHRCQVRRILESPCIMP
ncbi:hypothetical protein C8Q73DRAFT_717742 [Cubamyces lactineus]|nr:hypothetical protein C8Q73DRAFT_717742 [Cubamyces lactineus]